MLTTKKYSIFKFLTGNRAISKKKVANIVKSYKSGIDLFPYCPILVNEDFFVIDGQHRFEAAKELGLEIYYLVVPNFTLTQIAEMNSNTDKWSNQDFMNCYIEIGNEEYKALKEFKDYYNVSYNVALCLLGAGGIQGGGSHEMDGFRNGSFKIKQLKKATELMDKTMEYQGFTSEINNRNFIRAISLLLPCPAYKHDEVIAKLKRNKEKIEKCHTPKDYIFHIEHLFNRDNTKRQIIYQ